MDITKTKRKLSAMTKSDCILLLINKEAFELAFKEKMRKERDEMGRFIYQSVPKLRDFFGIKTVTFDALIIFKQSVL